MGMFKSWGDRQEQQLQNYKAELERMKNTYYFRKNGMDQIDKDDFESEIYMMESIISDLEFEINNSSNYN